MVATTKELILTFPAQHTLGNLYLSKQVFPHNRTWVGQAAGEAKLNLPPESMIGLALSHDVDAKMAEGSAAALNQIHSMDLSTSKYSAPFLAAMMKLSALRELRLDFLTLSTQDFINLNESSCLETLWLTGSSVDDQMLPVLQGVKSLTSLILKSTKISNSSMKALATLPKLKNLHLPATITDDGAEALSQSASIEDLDLSYTALSAAAIKSLAVLKTLSTLYVNDTTLGDDSVAYVKDMPALKVLFLNGTQITDKCLDSLAEAAQLEHLELRDTKVTEIGIARLRGKMKDCAIFGP